MGKKRKPQPQNNLNTRLSSHLKSLPLQIVKYLEREFQKIHEQYFLGKWEPSQLDAGRFSEMVLRVVEFHYRQDYTPIGEKLNREKIIGEAAKHSNLEDSLRLTIPKLAGLLLDFRNNRDVAHISNIDVNSMDATFIIQTANWIMAELVRLETKRSPEEAQKEITKIIERKVPLVEEIGDRLKCLDPRLPAKKQALVFCYLIYPRFTTDEELFSWVGVKNKSRFKGYLVQLDKEKLLDYKDNEARLTKRGLLWIEKYIKFDLKV